MTWKDGRGGGERRGGNAKTGSRLKKLERCVDQPTDTHTHTRDRSGVGVNWTEEYAVAKHAIVVASAATIQLRFELRAERCRKALRSAEPPRGTKIKWGLRGQPKQGEKQPKSPSGQRGIRATKKVYVLSPPSSVCVKKRKTKSRGKARD